MCGDFSVSNVHEETRRLTGISFSAGLALFIAITHVRGVFGRVSLVPLVYHRLLSGNLSAFR